MRLHIAILLLFTVGVIIGCRPYESENVRLSGWLSFPGEEKMVLDLIDEYQEQSPGRAVQYLPITANYDEKIQLMLGTGTAPDVFMVEAFWAPNLISYDVLLPLDSLIEADPSFALHDIEPKLLDAFRVNGKLYGIPKDYSTLVLWYNPELFKEAGLDKPPSNWEELQAYAEILTKDRDGDGSIDQYGFVFPETLEYLLPLAWQNQGDFFDENGAFSFTDPEFVEAVSFLKEMHDAGHAVLPTQVSASWNMDAFGRQRAAMAISGLWGHNFLNSTFPETAYNVAPLPIHKEQVSIAFIVGYVIPRKSKHIQDAWKLLSYLTGKEGQLAWADAGVGLPPRYSVVDRKGLRSDSIRSVFIESAPYARPWQLGSDQRVYAEAQTALQSIFLTDTPILEALQHLEDRLTR